MTDNRGLLKPRLWDLFQAVVGTNSQKRAFLRRSFDRPGRVLEIGCATGNVAHIFTDRAYDYVGIDIEAASIALAARKFRKHPNLEFIAGDLADQCFVPASFDFVVISHTAHHIPDGYFASLLRLCHGLLRDGGEVVILDMVRPGPADLYSKRFYFKLDRGEYFRDAGEFGAILAGGGDFKEVRTQVLECRKFGIRVIDQILIRARK